MDKSGEHHNAQIKGFLIKLLQRGPAIGAPVEIKVPFNRVPISVTVQGPVKRPCREAVDQFGF